MSTFCRPDPWISEDEKHVLYKYFINYKLAIA